MLRCQNRTCIFFRIHDHTAELQNVKLPAIAGHALLLKEHRAAVFQFDSDGNRSHKGSRNQQSNRTDQQVHRPLANPLSRSQAGTLHQQQRRVKQGDVLCAPKHDIRQLRCYIGANPVTVAILQNVITHLSRHIIEDHRIMIGNFLQNGIQSLVHTDQLLDIILILTGIHFDLQSNAALMTIDQKHIMGCIQLVINGGIDQDQNRSHHNFNSQQRQHRLGIQNCIADQAKLQISDCIDHEQRYDLSDQQIHLMELTKHGAFKVLEERIQQNAVNTHQNIFALIGKVFHMITLFPHPVIHQSQDHNLQQRFRHPEEAFCIFVCAAT